MVFRFSPDTGKAAQIVFADGQTGSIHREGEVIKDPVPVYDHGNGKSDISLDVADAKTGEILWTGSHRGGGLLTGFDSAGARVLKLLEKQMAK